MRGPIWSWFDGIDRRGGRWVDTQTIRGRMAAEASPPPPPLGERPAGLIQTGFAAWLRRYRRSLPIPLAVLVLIFFPPTYPLASPGLDLLSDIVGTAVCLLGQWLRAWAWGSNAEVAKFGVRERGPYALMRHPLYAGNFLIVLGLVVMYHNPWVYPLFLLPFAYLYDANHQAGRTSPALALHPGLRRAIGRSPCPAFSRP